MTHGRWAARKHSSEEGQRHLQAESGAFDYYCALPGQ
jgi:hypothetical protein